MKTLTKQPKILKRIIAVIMLSVFMMAGMFSQKSNSQGLLINSNDLKNSIPEVLDNWTKKPECVMNLSSGSRIHMNYEEATDEEMNIEDWMLEKFSIETVDKPVMKDEPVKEEEMQIEDWMLNVDHWLVATK
jgi:hypothetical protein